MIVRYGLQGMDLDVEQVMSQAGITRLVRRLAGDFGPDFAVTLAPVASALENGGGNLSGFNYTALERAAGPSIAFYNAQFYNGFGSMASPDAFDAVVGAGGGVGGEERWPPAKIVAGQITTPADGADFVPFDVLNATIVELRREYGEIGGIMGWEYFNSRPGGTAEPWEWAQEMTLILRPGSVVSLTITEHTARMLVSAWKSSSATIHGGETVESSMEPTVDYTAMINA